jgi:hypothetical protein
MLRADVCVCYSCTDIPQNLNPGQDTREQTTKRTHERRHEGAHQHRPTNQPTSQHTHTHTQPTNQPPPSLTRSAPELVGRQDPPPARAPLTAPPAPRLSQPAAPRIYPECFRSVVVRHSMLATGVARASASQRGLSAQGPPLAPGPVSATGVTDASSIIGPLSASTGGGTTFDERGRC